MQQGAGFDAVYDVGARIAGPVAGQSGIDVSGSLAITLNRRIIEKWASFCRRLPDDVRPEAVWVRWGDSVQVKDRDEGPQQGGGPVVEWSALFPMKDFAAQVFKSRRPLIVALDRSR